MKKILRISGWSSLVLATIVTTAFIDHDLGEETCSDVVIDITDEKSYGFISEGDVSDLLNREFNTPISQKVKDIHTYDIEKRLRKHEAVKEAEVYITIDGKLVIRLWQRRPIIRVFSKGGSFYIDEFGEVMPVMQKFTAHVPVASGNIDIPFKEIHKMQRLGQGENKIDTSLYNDLFKLAQFIDSRQLWRAQIEQVYVDKDSEVELIPRVGNHTIVLGEVQDLEEKFEKLMLFYNKGLNKTGWNEFRKINLKFKDQVVCTKRYING